MLSFGHHTCAFFISTNYYRAEGKEAVPVKRLAFPFCPPVSLSRSWTLGLLPKSLRLWMFTVITFLHFSTVYHPCVYLRSEKCSHAFYIYFSLSLPHCIFDFLTSFLLENRTPQSGIWGLCSCGEVSLLLCPSCSRHIGNWTWRFAETQILFLWQAEEGPPKMSTSKSPFMAIGTLQICLKWGSWDWEILWNYSRGPSGITQVLVRGKQGSQSEETWWWIRGQSAAATSRGMWEVFRSGERQINRFSSRPSRKKYSSADTDFSPITLLISRTVRKLIVG